MTPYPVWVGLGIALAALAAARQPPLPGVAPLARMRLSLAATIGALLGAYLFELPADLLGWAAPIPGSDDPLPLGGRTVLGGLIGGWLAVEVAKRALGVEVATGDSFALPLAVALTCGRIGCATTGCCYGEHCSASWWATTVTGDPRLPVQWLEVAFHACAALALLFAARRGLAPGRRLAIYLACYAALRFALEGWRANPPMALGLTWYQWLALGLLAIAGGTWIARARAARLAPAAITP